MKNLTAELICTRISHDIMGSIGAIGNATELLEEGDMDFIDDIKSILNTSFENLSKRMKFFRLVFGVDNSNLTDGALVEKTACEYTSTLGNKNYPIDLHWGEITTANVKPALLAMMVMADLMLRGGKLSVTQDKQIIIAGIAKDAKISPDKWQHLQDILQAKLLFDANMAPLAALVEIAGNDNVQLIENNDIYGLAIKVTE